MKFLNNNGAQNCVVVGVYGVISMSQLSQVARKMKQS
jgi:hypothetical protein